MSTQYSIEKDGRWLTGNMMTGRYEFTAYYVRRYQFSPIEHAQTIAAQFAGSKVVEG